MEIVELTEMVEQDYLSLSLVERRAYEAWAAWDRDRYEREAEKWQKRKEAARERAAAKEGGDPAVGGVTVGEGATAEAAAIAEAVRRRRWRPATAAAATAAATATAAVAPSEGGLVQRPPTENTGGVKKGEKRPRPMPLQQAQVDADGLSS